MARIVKEHEYIEKRSAILDVVQQLVETKGYEHMAIQDILDTLQISKGALYHYFDSKQALLEALIERMQDEVDQLLLSLVQEPHLNALEKLQRFFDTLIQWKGAQKPFVLALLRIWYTDGNVLVRQKLYTARITRATPQLSVIIHQGIQEGVLTTSYPDQVGRVILSLFHNLSDTLAGFLLSGKSQRDEGLPIEQVIAASTEALERVLGAPKDSLHLINRKTLQEWMISPEDQT